MPPARLVAVSEFVGEADGHRVHVQIQIGRAEVRPVSEFLAAEELVMSYVKSSGQKSAAKYNDLRKEFQSRVGEMTKRIGKKK